MSADDDYAVGWRHRIVYVSADKPPVYVKVGGKPESLLDRVFSYVLCGLIGIAFVAVFVGIVCIR